MAYATLADLATYTGEESTSPGDERLLQRASELIDTALMSSFYVVDLSGVPTDPRVVIALNQATCAQVEWWKKTDDDTGIGAFQSLKTAPGSLEHLLQGGGQGASRLAPRTAEILSNAASTAIVAPPLAPSGSPLAGGSLAPGTYALRYTFVASAWGETAASPASANIVLAGGSLQIAVAQVQLPGWASAAKWYFDSGPTTGFCFQSNGVAFTLNSPGTGVVPPTATPVQAGAGIWRHKPLAW
jgi:hypothetical protein